MTSENLKKIYEYDTAIKNCLEHQWSLQIKIYMINLNRNTVLN